MNIHEYQGKELLRGYGVTVLEGHVAWTPEEAEAAAAKLPGPVYVVKSQIHAGGRGAGRFADDPDGKGGVRLAKSPAEARAAAEAMIGHTLVTKQTGPAGRKVQPGLRGGRLRHQARAVPVAAGGPRHLAGHGDGLHRGRHGDRGGGRAPPREDPARRRRPGERHLRLPRPQAGLRAGAGGQAGRRVRQVRGRHVQGVRGAGLRHRRDQPAGGDRRGRRRGARCQGELRRQRAVSPSRAREAARRGGGGPQGAGGRQVQPELRGAGRHDRLHGERRRAGDGHHGHHQAVWRRARPTSWTWAAAPPRSG